MRIVRFGDRGEPRETIETESEGILVLAGNDDLVSETRRRLREGVGK